MTRRKGTLTERERLAYDAGFIDGLRAVAHHTKGETLVGTTPLENALHNRRNQWLYSPRLEEPT